MKLPIYQIDAFSDHIFGGNPAAIVPLEKWLDDAVMQNIAMENNLSETGFFIPHKDGFHIRYFTPNNEVKFCGHATLAASHAIMEILEPTRDAITFKSANGAMHISKNKQGHFVMNVPVWNVERIDVPESLINALQKNPISVHQGEYMMARFETAQDIADLSPKFHALKAFNKADAIICTAPADNDDDADFVSRFFCPRYGIDEDPVTGSAHAILAPYWAEKLGKTDLKARQISKRGGALYCSIDKKNGRVDIKGHAVLYMSGEITL